MKLFRGMIFEYHRIPMPAQFRRLNPKMQEGEYCGAFTYQSPESPKDVLRVLADVGEDWDHVSISLVNRCPTWGEMEYIKRMFFEEHETAMQLHVPPAEHINNHRYVLHLWRPRKVAIPIPPREAI